MTQHATIEDQQDQPYAKELELLTKVLEPLGPEQCQEIVNLAAEYIREVSPITWAAGSAEPGEAGAIEIGKDEQGQPVEVPTNTWAIGQPSPLTPDYVTFALFYDDATGTLVALLVQFAQGQNGELVAQYKRERIFNPRYASGPLSLESLYNDLKFFLTYEPEPEPN